MLPHRMRRGRCEQITRPKWISSRGYRPVSFHGTSIRFTCSALGRCELTERSTDGIMKGAAFIAFLDPVTSLSEDTSASPCLRLFKTKSYLDYLHAPGNKYLTVRLQAAVGGVASAESSTAVPGGLPRETLSEGTMIVDVVPLLKFTQVRPKRPSR